MADDLRAFVGRTLRSRVVREAAFGVAAIVVEHAGKIIKERIDNVNAARSEDAQNDFAKAVVEEDPGLAILGEVQDRIRTVERLDVVFVHRKTRRDVRDDRRGFPPYPYVYKAADDLTVKEFISRRLDQYESFGIEAEVRHANGERVHGNTRLREVRRDF